MKQGNYFGTEVGGKWWRRYHGPSFFARGNGEFWMDEQGIHFLKKLTKNPLTIEWDEVSGARIGKSHAGRRVFGRPVLKIAFQREALDLEAGFFLSSEIAEMERFATDINERVAGN